MAELAGGLRLPCAGRTGVAGVGAALRLRLRGLAAGVAGVGARAPLCKGAGAWVAPLAPALAASSSSSSYTGHVSVISRTRSNGPATYAKSACSALTSSAGRFAAIVESACVALIRGTRAA